jgi:hypothetical protein
MQNKTVWALAALVGACAVGCNAGGSGPNSSTKNKSGASGSSGQQGEGASSSGGLAGVDSPDLTVNPDNPTIHDPDPMNPNIAHPKCAMGTCLDFPAEPIMGEGVPANAAMLFGEPSEMAPSGLCVLEPQLSAPGKEGAMLPANWVRPRFRVAAPAGIDLLEIRLRSPA